MLFSTNFALAQQATKLSRVGIFHVGLDHVPPTLEPLRRELKALGYEEGKNLQVDWRNLPSEEAARATAREFKRDGVDLIVAYENQTVRAAQAATSEIPILFLAVTDPVAEGFVKTLAHPREHHRVRKPGRAILERDRTFSRSCSSTPTAARSNRSP